MTDVDTDWGDRPHLERAYDEGSRVWIDNIQAVLDEITADLRAANPDAKELGGIALPGSIDANVRPLVACTWLELTQVQAHSWLGCDDRGNPHTAAWSDLLRSLTLRAQRADYGQVAHYHLHGEPCNRNCRLVRPDWDSPVRPATEHGRI